MLVLPLKGDKTENNDSESCQEYNSILFQNKPAQQILKTENDHFSSESIESEDASDDKSTHRNTILKPESLKIKQFTQVPVRVTVQSGEEFNFSNEIEATSVNFR